jgi:uncharacterized protein
LPQSLGIENVLSGLRAALAKELVIRGYSQKRISEIICTSPAAVTLYAKGKRGNELSRMIRTDKSANLVIDNLLDRLSRFEENGSNEKSTSGDAFPLILDAAYRIMRMVSSSTLTAEETPEVSPKNTDSIEEPLVTRLQQEQLAAQRNMALAVGTTDEVARTIFRQIASDSIRHSEIVSFLISRKNELKTNKKRSKKMIDDEIQQIESMLREEESATEEPIKLSGNSIDPFLALLLKSIDIDEEKHRMLLGGLLKISKKALDSRD